jgi:hypothetical protein
MRRLPNLVSRVGGIIGLAAFLCLPQASAFSFLSPLSLFPEGPIYLDLRLGSPENALIDGNTSWDTVIENAGAAWNNYISLVQFNRYAVSPKAPAASDGVNQVYWDDTVNGVPFGTFTLAITTRWTQGSVCTEADVVFDVTKRWNSYRGPLRTTAGGSSFIHELFRVGEHELGHVLGLGHPDEDGQHVAAVMNSIESDTGNLTADDIEGARMLYFGLAPSITQQPTDQTIAVGGTAQFSVQADGVPAPRYQWYWNNVLMTDATNATLSITDARLSDAGTFRVQLKNSHGTLSSETAKLTVLAPPLIVTSPASRSVRSGKPVAFSVTANGTKPFSYQWLHNGDPIPNATNATYTFTPTAESDGGDYAVRVANGAGTVTSDAAQLTVLFVPQVELSTGDLTVLAGTNLVFSANLQGTEPFTYRWLLRGRALPGATNSQLTLTNIGKASAGSYVLEVRNAAATVRSTPIRLTVIIPPAIKVPPQPLTVHTNLRAVLRVTATGTKPLLYQWLKDGVEIPDAIKRSLVIPHAQLMDAGNYSVRISNAGAAVESVPVALTVIE